MAAPLPGMEPQAEGAQRIGPLYDTGTRTLVLEHGRVGVGEVVALDETPREPLYAIRFNAERRLMFLAHEVAAYRPTRYETLDGALRAIFAGFRAEDAQ